MKIYQFSAKINAYENHQPPFQTDRVSHGGSIWLCNAEGETGTTDEPSRASSDWLCEVERGGAGVDGQDGADGQNGVDGANGQNGVDGANGQNGVDGVDGVDGQTPIIYQLAPSALAVKKDKAGVVTPSPVSCRVELRVGAEREIIGSTGADGTPSPKIDFAGRNLLRNTSRTIEQQPGHYGFMASYACQKLVVGQTYVITVEIETGVEPLWILWGGSWETSQGIYLGVPFLAQREYVEFGVHDSHLSNLQLLRFKNISIQAGSSAGAYQPAPEDYTIQLNGAAYTAGTAIAPEDTINWTLHDPSKPTTAEPINRQATIFSEDIEFGGVNLVLNSKKGWRSTAYSVLRENLSQDWVVGQTYTITVKGTVNSPNAIGLWRDNGDIHVGNLTPIGADIYRLTFVCPAPYAGQALNRFSLYNFPSQTATLATIEWIKLERGNRATDWSPAPEDVQGAIDTVAKGFGFQTQAELDAYLSDLTKGGIFKYDSAKGQLDLSSLIAGRIAADEAFTNILFATDFTAINATVGKLLVYDDLSLPVDQRKVVVSVDRNGVKAAATTVDSGGDIVTTNNDNKGRVTITRGDITPLSTTTGSGVVTGIVGQTTLAKGNYGVMLDIPKSQINVKAQNASITVSGELSFSTTGLIGSTYLELYLYCEGVRVGVVFGTGIIGGNGYIPIQATINASKTGIYSLVLKVYPFEGVSTGTVDVAFSQGQIEWEYIVGERRIQLGRNGITSMRSITQHFHSSIDDYGDCTNSLAGKNTIAGTTSLTGSTKIIGTVVPPVSGPGNGGVEMRVPKGAAPDMPGVLRAGSVSVNGTSAGAWGYRKAAPKRNSQGAYRITHAIGHTNYYFSGTLIGGFTGAVKIMNKQTSYIDVEVRGLDGNLYDCGFDYMICGTNYNT